MNFPAPYFRTLFRCMILAVLVNGVPLSAQEILVPVQLQVELLMKILSLERNHNDKTTNTITLCLLYQSNFRRSLDARTEALKALGRSGKSNLTIKEIDLDQQELGEGIENVKPQVLLLCPLRSYTIEDIAALSQKKKILTSSLVAEYVNKQISIGIDIEHDRPHIIINMQAARQEHADFDSRLLRIARLIEPYEP
jgi:hypothetical protein